MRVRVVGGAGTGPTETAAYDAALLDAGVGNYNLVTVSSVVPAEATVSTPDTVPDLGRVGDRLTVVQARAVGDRVGAALAWGHTDDGEGLFYEGSAVGDGEDATDGGTDPLADRARREAERGLTAGFDRRGWTPVERETLTATATVTAGADGPASGYGDGGGEHARGRYAAAVALAVYGEGTPLG